MKKIKKLLSVLLISLMILTLLPVSVFANDEEENGDSETDGGYKTMLSFGTSISRGYDLPGYGDQDDEGTIRGLEGSYPSLVANELDIDRENRYFCTYKALTLNGVLHMLNLEDDSDPMYTQVDSFSNAKKTGHYDYTYSFFGPNGNYKIIGEDGLIAKSDLITLELGSSDIFYRSINLTDFEDVVSSGTTAEKAKAAKQTIEYLYDGYNYVVDNYPRLLDYIKSVNPDAEVVIVGMYNLVYGVRITDSSVVEVGNAFSAITASMNQYLRSLAAQYGYEYADISNTDTPASIGSMSLNDFMDDANTNVHPTAEGNYYMYRQVMNVIPEKTTSEQESKDIDELIEEATHRYDIVIDLGYMGSVDTVKVNGIRISNYEFDADNHVLTIHYNNPFAVSATVSGVDSSTGKTILQNYQLAYHNGYIAYRVYNTSDLEGTKQQIVTNVTKVTEAIKEKLPDSDEVESEAMTRLQGIISKIKENSSESEQTVIDEVSSKAIETASDQLQVLKQAHSIVSEIKENLTDESDDNSWVSDVRNEIKQNAKNQIEVIKENHDLISEIKDDIASDDSSLKDHIESFFSNSNWGSIFSKSSGNEETTSTEGTTTE